MRKLATLHAEQEEPAGGFGTINQPNGLISAVQERTACWIRPAGTQTEEGAVFRFQLPFGVVIGDSISAGSPQTRSRMQIDGAPGFSPAHRNVPGQLSYELGAITGLHWYNHGIGGQRTDEIWARWRRDVLAETIELGDARGTRTLPRKPYVVFIVAGINDVFQNRDDGFIQRYWIQMAKSAKEHGILCLFSNMGDHNAATPAWRDQIRRLNAWMAEELLQYGATVVDFYEWSLNRDRGIGVHPGLFCDDVHPSRSGFQSLAYHFASQFHGLPVYLQGIQLESVMDLADPLPGYSRASELAYTIRCDYAEDSAAEIWPSGTALCPDAAIQCLPIHSDGTGNLLELRVNRVHGAGAEFTGFSKARAVLGEGKI